MDRRARLGLILGIVAIAAWLAYFAVYQVDDAYIVYRYAANLAHGEGFAFNPGERVEGVTCFLWTLILALPALLGWPLPVTAAVLTGCAGLMVGLLLPGVAARLGGRARPDGGDLLCTALLAAHPGFAYWSVGGLETLPYTLLLLLALRGQVVEQTRGSGRISAIWVGLSTLMRPEALVVAAALFVGRILDGPGRGARARARELFLWCATVAAFLGPFLLFRRIYFGAWLPNTYYARTGEGWLQTLHDGRIYTLGFLSSLAPGFGQHNLVTCAIGGAALLGALAFALPRPVIRSAALMICGLALAVLLEGGDWMVLFRFWVPVLPAVVLVLATSARAASTAIPRLRTCVVLLGVIWVVSGAWAGVVARDGPNGLLINEEGYRRAHLEIAEYLRRHADPGDTVALMDIGRIGYETGLRIIDISGLTDREIARAPGGFLHKRYSVATLLEREPRFFVLVDGFPIDDAIRQSPDFDSRYRLALERNHRFNWTPEDEYWLRLYVRSR